MKTTMKSKSFMLTFIMMLLFTLPIISFGDETTNAIFDTMEESLDVIYKSEFNLEFDAIRGEYVEKDDSIYTLDFDALDALFGEKLIASSEEVDIVKTSIVTETTTEKNNVINTHITKTSSTIEPVVVPKVPAPKVEQVKAKVVSTTSVAVKPPEKKKIVIQETEVLSNKPMDEAKVRYVLEQMAPDLVGIEDSIIEVYEQYGIKPSFQIAKFCLESGYGKSNLAKNKNNIAGWNAYPTKTKSAYQNATYFNSKDDCVRTVGKSLNKNYIAYGKTSVNSIAKKYCPPNSDNWASMCKSIMTKADNLYKKADKLYANSLPV